MRNKIESLNKHIFLNWDLDVKSVNDDFFLFDQIKIDSVLNHPFRLDVMTCIICQQGECSGKVDLMPLHVQAPSITIMLSNTLLEYHHVSDDFKALVLLMSPRFLQSLNIEEWMSSYVNIRERPYIPINQEALAALVNYYNMCEGVLLLPDHPYKMETLRNLTRAFFYGAGYYFHKFQKEDSHKDPLLNNFLKLLKSNYRVERSLEFYAEKLSLSTKYMSSKIKQSTGKTASQLIDSYIIMEAKSLLLNSNMNVQQLSDYFNFPSQSFFGKFFKRLVGVSPKIYKKERGRIDEIV